MRNFIRILIFLSIAYSTFSQSGIKFLEFAKRLENYFDETMIGDIQKQLPQPDDYTIWGYDVGDFSGDGNNDVAITLRLSGDRSRDMQIFFFVDIDGYFRKVHHKRLQFLELPLEVGVAIRNNKCYVTKKIKQFNWDIYGYSYDNGSFILNDEFFTRKLNDLTYEKYRNYENLKGSEKYISLKNNKSIYEREFFVLPSYSRGRHIYKGIKEDLDINNVDNVFEGAYWWQGNEDCSFRITSAYDEEFIYFTLDITDDLIVTQNCDTCIVDYAELWIDVNQYQNGDRFAEKYDDKVNFRQSPKSGIYKFSIYPGDYVKLPPYCKLSTTDELNNEQKFEAKNIKVISNFNDTGYFLKFKIPWKLFDISIPGKDLKFLELGTSALVIDYDNEFRPEEVSKLTSSATNLKDVSKFGILKIIPDDDWYGISQNIFMEEIVKNLLQNGF